MGPAGSQEKEEDRISRSRDRELTVGLCPPAGPSRSDLCVDLWRLPCPGSEGAAQVMGKAARLRVHRAAHTPCPPHRPGLGASTAPGSSPSPEEAACAGRSGRRGAGWGAPSPPPSPDGQQSNKPATCPPAFTERLRLADPESIKRAPFPPPWPLPSPPLLFLLESSFPWVSTLAVPWPRFSFPVPGQGEGSPAKGHSGGGLGA